MSKLARLETFELGVPEIDGDHRALLELMKLSLLRIQQGKQFGAIRIYQAADQELQKEVLKDYQDSWDEESTPLAEDNTTMS